MAEFFVERQCWTHWPKVMLMCRKHGDGIERRRYVPDKGTCHYEWSLADNGWADHTCSACGFRENTDIYVSLGWNYCPNCGRKVVE